MKYRFNFRPIFPLMILLLVFSCKENGNRPILSKEGVYKSIGYGRIVKIENSEYFLADVTEISCLPLKEGEISEFGDALQFQNDTLSLEDGINTYYFRRIEDEPPVCKSGTQEYAKAESKTNDPEHNFEVLWKTFRDHYAYFELRNVDPDKMYKEYRPKVTSETTDAELFGIMYEMLESFNDGHIGISAPYEVEEAAIALMEKKTKTEEDVQPSERLSRRSVAEEVAEIYIKEGKTRHHDFVRWGIIDSTIGYLQLNQMAGYADYGIPDTLSIRDYYNAYNEMAENSINSGKDELDGLGLTLDEILENLGNTNTMIIDVRFNGGGNDEVGMAILERLNDTEKMVFTKKARLGDGFTPTIKVTQTASENPYKKPVYLLISTESASATEIMALSSLSMPNITRIGSRTEGVFSDVLDKTLPNGWEFGLSNEVYSDLQGNNYEGKGISPDIEIGYPRDAQKFLQKVLSDLENDGDAAIEKVLELVEAKK
ncbi:MAG: S41 family peptidase [Aurantibacter sp.]